MNLTARHRLVKIGEDGGTPPKPPAYRLFTEESHLEIIALQ